MTHYLSQTHDLDEAPGCDADLYLLLRLTPRVSFALFLVKHLYRCQHQHGSGLGGPPAPVSAPFHLTRPAFSWTLSMASDGWLPVDTLLIMMDGWWSLKLFLGVDEPSLCACSHIRTVRVMRNTSINHLIRGFLQPLTRLSHSRKRPETSSSESLLA